MRYLLTFFVLLFCQSHFGQKQKFIDSLELVIKDSKIDTLRLSAILSLTYIRGNENKTKHKQLIYQGISLAEKSNNLSFKGQFLSEYAYSFRRENEIDSSFYYYKKAQETLLQVGFKKPFDTNFSELSGGEQQRVGIARAIVNKPPVLLADEPTGNLDTQTSAELHQLLVNLKNDFGQTFVIVTHNNELAKLSDRCLEIVDGVIKNDL